MHIGLATMEYPPEKLGGIASFTKTLAQGLAAQGIEVTVWCLGEGKDEHVGRVKVEWVRPTKLPKLGWWVNRKRLEKRIRKAHNQKKLAMVEFPDWCGLSAGMQLPCPIAIRCHGSATYFAHLENKKVRAAVRKAEKKALEHAQCIAAVSAYAGEKTKELFKLRKPMKVIHNGIDHNQFFLGEKRKEQVVYIGTLIRKKGVLDLPDIFEKVLDKLPNIAFVLVGKDTIDEQTGTSTLALIRSACSPRVRAQLQYRGPVPADKIPEVLQKAPVCVFPSYAEALPLSWMEAMSCGCAVVGYDWPWSRELITSGETGILVRPGDKDACSKGIVHAMHHQELGKKASERVRKQFTKESMVEKTVEWYGHNSNYMHL